MRRRGRIHGITLVEILIAIAVLAIVLAIAYGGVIQGMRIQSGQEAATATQARLRRVTEVFTQELRGAVLGAVSNSPYTTGANAVSFMVLDGGAGYQVRSISGTGQTLEVVAPVASASDFGMIGRQAMAVDAGGQAVVFQVSSITSSGSNWQFNPTGSGCFLGLNTVGAGENRNMLLFAVQTLGARYDSASETLFQTEGTDAEQALAYNLSDVRMEYIYREVNSGDLHTLSAPLQVGGLPAKNAAISGNPVVLIRLQLLLESTAASANGDVVRSYQSQVDLNSNESFVIKAVRSC